MKKAHYSAGRRSSMLADGGQRACRTTMATRTAAERLRRPHDGLEAQLESARERLEEAAHEVAELSAEIGGPVMDRFMAFGEGPRRAIIGVQLDPASGKDGARVKRSEPRRAGGASGHPGGRRDRHGERHGGEGRFRARGRRD